MTEKELKCDRCEEPVKPVNLSTLPIIGRFVGNVVVTERTVHLQSIREKLGVMGIRERPSFSRTDVTLCDQCWGAFLSWVTDPGQERAKIAAENRRKDQRLQEVAERRREERMRQHMEGNPT